METTPILKAHLRPVWQRIKLGTRNTPKKYTRILQSRSALCPIKIEFDALELLSQISCAREEVWINLAWLYLEQLGLQTATYEEACGRGKELGYELCPAEVGPALRLYYQGQPRYEWLTIAMKAIQYAGLPHVFAVGCGSEELWLRAQTVVSVPGQLRAQDRLVFMYPDETTRRSLIDTDTEDGHELRRFMFEHQTTFGARDRQRWGT